MTAVDTSTSTQYPVHYKSVLLHGFPTSSLLDPTTWLVDQVGLDGPGNRDIQMDLMHDYGTNVPLYPAFQAFFRKYQPPTLIVWCKNDFLFPAEGAAPYPRDLKNVETHLLDTGHFAQKLLN